MQRLQDSPSARQIEAEILALRALGFIAEDDGRLVRFAALSGASAGDMKGRAGDPEFLGAVLDFLLADEPLLLAFTARVGLRPEAPYAARRRLPGAPADG